MEWIFTEQSNSEPRRDPSEAELFKNSQDNNEEYTGVDTLVREVIQNSIDAASKKQNIVRVRISLHSRDEMPSLARLKMYFRRLEEPLKTKNIFYTDKGLPDLPYGFLVCEDFGTRGLEGDPKLTKKPSKESKERQDFFWFWRNIGISGKTGDDLGRWGLGKTVYRMASAVGCMLGLTVRESDKSQLVMGQAVLKIHEYKGKEWKSDGYWCERPDKNLPPLPIEHLGEVERFREDWKLSRKDEPGLSVVVPYVVDIRGKSIFQAVAINFFTLILRRKLIVEINAPDIEPVILTDDTIEEACQKIEWDGTKAQKRHATPPIAFAKECIIKRENAVPTILLGETHVPKLSPESFEPSDLELLRKEFSLGNMVAAQIRLVLHKKEQGQSIKDAFHVFLKKDNDKKTPDSYYIREGMTITRINSTQARSNHTRGLVYIYKGPLASLLGDTEGPAHVDWSPSKYHERASENWERGWKGRVDFVRRIIDSFYEIVSPPIADVNYDLLSEYFFLEGRDVSRFPDTPAKTENTEDGTEALISAESSFPSIEESESKWFEFEKKTDGFRVFHKHQSLEIPADAVLEIQMAYDVSRGNALHKWHRFDFDLRDEKCQIKCTGKNSKVNISNGDGKTILLEDISKGFSLTVTGFNRHKDLYVIVTDKSGDNRKETE